MTPQLISLNPNDMDQFVERIADAVVKRLTARERAQARDAAKPISRLLSYAQAGELLGGKSAAAVKQMVVRRELKSVHPQGGRRAYIDSKALDDYIQSGKN